MTEVRAGYPIHINDSVHDQRCDGCQRPIEPGESYGKRHGIVFCLRWALVHKYAQSIEFITFFDLTQKNVPC
jgi:hypothetical protein